MSINKITIPSDIPAHSFYRLERSVNAFPEISSRYSGESAKDNDRDHLTWIFVNAIMDLYRGMLPPDFLKGKEIAICTFVERDGLGDFYHGLADRTIIEENYPQCPLTNVIEFPDFEKRRSNLTLPDRGVMILDSKEETLRRAIDTLQSASLVIDAPYGEFNLVNSGWLEDYSEKHQIDPPYTPPKGFGLAFQEYDGQDTCDDFAKWTLGVSSFHAGIIFIAPPKEASFAALKEKALTKFLFNIPAPSIEEFKKYEENHQFHYGYIKSEISDEISAVAFLLTIATSSIESQKTLDVILPMSDLR